MSARRTGLAALVAAVVASGFLAPASAANDPEQKKRRVDASVRQLQDEVHESSAQLRAAERQFRQAESQLPGAREALAAGQRQLAVARAAEADLARKLAAVQVAEAAAAANLRRVIQTVSDHRTTVGRIARRTYQNGGFSQLSVALEAESPQEFASRLAYLQVVMRSERNILTRLAEEQADLAFKRAQLEAVRLRVAEQRTKAGEAVERTRALERLAAAAAGRVQALVAQRKAAVNAAERERAADLKRYREMQAESQRLAALIRARAAAARSREAPRASRSGGGYLSYPVNGPITSPFGMRYHPILHYYKLHTGTDFGVPSGAAVSAARAGTVIQSYFNGAYGNRVVVDHGYLNGVYLVTTYNHLSSRAAAVGARVSRGQVLGYSGNTGYSTGPHLHFETLENGSFVNPMRWL